MSEFRRLVDQEFGQARGDALVRDHVVAGLGHRTGREALDAGDPPRTVWLALCRDLDVPQERWLGTDDTADGRGVSRTSNTRSV